MGCVLERTLAVVKVRSRNSRLERIVFLRVRDEGLDSSDASSTLFSSDISTDSSTPTVRFELSALQGVSLVKGSRRVFGCCGASNA